MESLLQGISAKLQQLPQTLQNDMENLVDSTLIRVITIDHMDQRMKIMQNNTKYFPRSTLSEFTLTSKKEIKDSNSLS